MIINSSCFTDALYPFCMLMRSIRQALCPHAESVSAEFYKLVVYGEGGHFVKHCDTLRSANHVGTLLIGLPTEDGFEGGELVVDRLEDEPLKLSAKHWNRDDLSSSYVAFFTDSEHELCPITEGYRLTMMYHIIAEFDSKGPNQAKEEHWTARKSVKRKERADADATEIQEKKELHENGVASDSLASAVEKMLQLMQQEAKEEEARVKAEVSKEKRRYRLLWDQPQPAQCIGFMLNHKYSWANASVEFLRGRDAVLYALLKGSAHESKLSVRVNFVNVKAECEPWSDRSLVGHFSHSKNQGQRMDYQRNSLGRAKE